MQEPLSIDFITTAKLNAAEQMYEYFVLNPEQRMTDYEPITGGLRAYFENVIMEIVILQRNDGAFLTLKKHSSIQDKIAPSGSPIRVIVDVWNPEDGSTLPKGLEVFDFDRYSIGDELTTETDFYTIIGRK